MANIRVFQATLFLLVIINLVIVSSSESDNERLTSVKKLGFMDPKSGFRYQVQSYNITSMTTDSRYRSRIKVYRIHINEKNQPYGDKEDIQTINYHPLLVDMDLHCQPTHCYLVVVTSMSKRNIELFGWQRTQFDLLSKKDSFARPNAVKLFNINSAFYVAIAQEQMHLARSQLMQEYEEPTRFIGCAILKFTKGHESGIKYHQFIKLPFNPLHLYHYVSYTHSGQPNSAKATENHYIVFSVDPKWQEPGSARPYSFMWSPLDDYFWPVRLPRGVTLLPPIGPIQQSNSTYVPTPRYPILKFPGDQFQTMNLTQISPKDRIDPIETCFNQLQQVLANRELYARKLIDSSRSLWQRPQLIAQSRLPHPMGVTNVTAQVFVKGSVIVKGTLVEFPQITMVSSLAPNLITVNQISALANDHSPAIVENRLRQAAYRLRYIRDKLSKAVMMMAYDQLHTQVSSRINFFGPLQARQIIFRGSGISNSNVRLNGIPFQQLENELVNLRGTQDIAPNVIFAGNVVADLLEIHGVINGEYRLRDAVDITSRSVQILTGRPNRMRRKSIYRFNSVASPEVILSPNATFNSIRLDDFITTGPQAQRVSGRKVFKQLSMARLDIGNPHVLLNGINISRLATSSIFVQNASGKPHQFIEGHHQTFLREISATRLTLRNVVNQHIDMSILIHKSVKTDDSDLQQISGFKRFQQGLRISRLTTDGKLNDIMISKVFNLNGPSNYTPGYFNHTTDPITGSFEFGGPISVSGNMNVHLINEIDINKHAVQRKSQTVVGKAYSPQKIQGKKIFLRPLRITERVGLLTPQSLNNTEVPRPLINDLDIKTINPGISRQMQNPPLITIDELDIEGNLNLPTVAFSANGAPRTTFGNSSWCPLDVIRSRLVSSGPEIQYIDVPTRIETLRARSIYLDPKGLNGFSFPADFVLRSTGDHSEMNPNKPVPTEFVFGQKSFRHISIAPPLPKHFNTMYIQGQNHVDDSRSVFLGPLAKVNNISYGEIQTFVNLDRQKNSTGVTVLQTLYVYGNIIAKRINGNHWPDDILLKSIVSNSAQPSPNLHRRIYSPLIFTNYSNLMVENQLVLRGPLQLRGRFNGVNLTDFARKSVTYGDKDLLSSGRPLSNKIFAGGLTVNSEVRAQGLIDGVNFDDMRRRAVPIGPSGKTIHMIAPKVFMSDVNFFGPLQVTYLNNLPVDHYLRRARYDPVNNLIKIFGKKMVSGTLVVNQNLVVQGLINNIDFIELGQRAISVRPGDNSLQFNKTMTIEGNAYMDNLYVDENKGTIDGVKLSDLQPISHNPAPLQLQVPAHNSPRPIYYNGNVTYVRTTPPYATTTSYHTSKARGFGSALHLNPELSHRPPMSIRYELPQPSSQKISPRKSPIISQHLDLLRSQFASSSIIQVSPTSELVIGFIDSISKDIANLHIPDNDPPYAGTYRVPTSFIQLDQVDYSFKPTTYHCRVGISTNYNNPNSTQVICSVGGVDLHQLDNLPVESPNSAMFMKDADKRGLFLLISEDTTSRFNPRQCVPARNIPAPSYQSDIYGAMQQTTLPKIGGSIHIYLFHSLQNSSSLSSAFFDLYQTIDLPAVDSFESFNYKRSTYALAVSRALETVHLLLLRGYSGFQMVSMIRVPGIEYVTVLYSADQKPFLVLHQTNGLYRLMESVII